MTDLTERRGYRNRNPGNIDYVATNRWQGQVGMEPRPLDGSRPRFAAFETHEHGIRALAALLTTYFDRHGLRTVHQIISRWAPGNENNTAAYVRAVAAKIGVGPNDRIDLHDYAVMRPLVVAIITHELGGNPYPASVIDEGLRMAGLPKPVETLADAAATGTGRGAMDVAKVVSAAAPAAALVQALGGLSPWTGVALVFAATAVAVLLILLRRRDRLEPA